MELYATEDLIQYHLISDVDSWSLNAKNITFSLTITTYFLIAPNVLHFLTSIS